LPRAIGIARSCEIRFILILCVLSAWISYVRAAAPEDAELVRLAEGVYARIVSPDSNAVTNAGFVVLDHSVLVFDTHFTAEAGRDLLATIRSVTRKPVRYVVNSNWHSDHTRGNQVFRDACFIGSTNARRAVLQNDIPSVNRILAIVQKQLEDLRADMEKEEDSTRLERFRAQIEAREKYLRTMSQQHILAPHATVDDELTIVDGSREIRIRYLGKGHTDSDIVVFLPSKKIAFLGGLFFNKSLPNVEDGFILHWMETLEKILELDAEIFVPGHGPVGCKKDVESFLRYFKDLEALVKPAVERGDNLELAMEEIRMPDKYSAYWFQNFFPSNIQKMYRELREQQLLESFQNDAE